MSELEIGGVYYHCNPLSTQLQWYVYRRLTPVFQGLAPLLAMTELVRGPDGAIRPDMTRIPIMAAMNSLVSALGNLSDEDTDYIKAACLDAVRWQQGNAWMPLRAPGGALLQGLADRFDVQLRLVWEVMRTSFENFSPEIAFPFLSTNSTNGVDQAAVQDMAATTS